MKRILIIIIIAILALVAYATNPTEAQHQEAVKESFRAGVGRALQVNGIKPESSFFGEITGSLFENVVWSELLSSSVKRDNYYLFSTAKVKYLDKEYTAGIGIFGKVYIFNQAEDQVQQKVDELIKKGGGLKKSLGF